MAIFIRKGVILMRIDNSVDNFIFPSGARFEDNTLIPSKYDKVVLYCP